MLDSWNVAAENVKTSSSINSILINKTCSLQVRVGINEPGKCVAGCETINRSVKVFSWPVPPCSWDTEHHACVHKILPSYQ